jgi:hypothetical protein
MKAPDPFLLDRFLVYAQECGVTINEAATIVAEFAKQRAPELATEVQILDVHYKLRRKVESSPSEQIVARFLVKTRVRYIAWTYYPDYHVCSSPYHYWWCTIWYDEPNWKPTAQPDRFYLDDLFHDKDEGKFWMHEPYLENQSESRNLFEALTKPDFEKMEGTQLRKIDPRIMAAFKAKRTGIPEFTSRLMEIHQVLRRAPYGSKGWQQRIKLVPFTYKRVRLA